MEIVLTGTPGFAIPPLKKTIEAYGVESVFTQPDKPKGRGKRVICFPIKDVALESNIKVFQPVKLKEDTEALEYPKELKPDFIIVVAFGQMLIKEVLDILKYRCINLHASLLPMYRGAAPLNWAVMEGEKKSGNITMLMDVGLDTGDMLLNDEVEMTDNMTARELHDVLVDRGAELPINTIDGLYNGSTIPEKQSEETFYAKMLNKELGKINWNDSAEDIHNLIRGLNPWPIAHTTYDDKSMKIYESEVLCGNNSKEPGTIINVSKESIKVSTGSGVLLIRKIQFPDGKPLTIEQYINGNELEINEKVIQEP